MKVVITMVMVFCCCCHELSSLGVVYFSLYITYVLLLWTKKIDNEYDPTAHVDFQIFQPSGKATSLGLINLNIYLK